MALLAAVLVVSGWLTLRTWPPSPGSVIDFELAGDDGVRRFLNEWGIDERREAAKVVLLDLPFLVAYGLGGALLLDGAARWSASLNERWVRFLRRCAWLPIVAACLDVVENVALLVVTTNRVDGWPDLAEVMARLKFGVLSGFYAVLLAALVSALIARRRRVGGGSGAAPAPA
ncbi:MAG TPA: hypothetical protein VD926_00335 [Acidimicrobiales bacterium]|nr:hypothetical protein [Acidimicrobiales bacterium]